MQGARLQSLDTVRGVAVMGILLMNIVAFAMPAAAYFNPLAYGGAQGADLIAWLVNFILFDGKMRGLFSVLFGASMLLVIERAGAKGESAAGVHFNRMGWLLVFGLAHLWLVWWGDILSLYAPVGMFAFLFRNMRVRTMVIVGLVLVLVETVLLGALPASVAALSAVPAGSPEAAEAARQLAEFQRGFGVPADAEIARNLALFRGDYASIVADRFQHHWFAPLTALLLFGAETLGYMLFGMAALRTGMLRGEWSRARYVKWMLVGFGLGIPAYAAMANYLVSEQFTLFAVTLAMALAVPARPLMILGWACLILLLARSGGWLTGRIAAAGRMAFTNYLATSLICTIFFYGYGFGWYGHLSRAELYLVVAAVWVLMLLWSKPWLARFRYGPFEWLWRSLARGSLQPMRGPAGNE